MADPKPEDAPSSILPVEPVPEAAPKTEDGKKWDKVLVVAGGSIPSGEKRPVIVCETRDDKGGHHDHEYPKGGDLYLKIHGPAATDSKGNEIEGKFDEPDFGPNEAAALVVGRNIEQGLLWGFSGIQGVVHVGPGHPAYAAANLAYLQGAKEIEIVGLSPYWKAKLQPWFNALPTDKRAPADVKITLS